MSAEKIGPLLRERRLELKLSLNEVAAQTRIRKTYIEALEEGRFEELPGRVYVIGFLQNYARALGLPSAPLIEAMPSPGKNSEGEVKTMVSTAPTVLKPSRFPARWLLLLVVVSLLLLVVVWLVPRWFGETPQPAAKPPVEVAEQPVAMNVAEEPAEVSVEQAPVGDEPVVQKEAEVTPQLPAGGGTLKIVVDGRGHFRIAIDGGHRREYVAKPGLALSWRVKQIADLELEVDGEVRLLIDGKEYTVDGSRHLQLMTADKKD